MKSTTTPPSDIDAYIAEFPKEIQKLLTQIRRVIRKAAPKSVEVISYRMPAVKYNSRIVVYFAAFKKHIGLFPPVPKPFAKECALYSGPKGNLQFPLSEPIPYDLIVRIVKYRVEEIEVKNASITKKKLKQ